MGIKISGRFTPLRLILTRREPVQFALSIINADEEEKRLTVKILLSSDLALTKGGFKNSDLIRVDSLKPGREKNIYFDLYPRHSTREGEQSISVKVQEHDKNFQFTKSQFSANFSLPVQK